MSLWPGWAAGATFAFGLFIWAGYFLPAYAHGLAALALLCVLLLTAAGSGRVMLSLLRLSDLSESQKTMAGTTLGLGVLSLGTFLITAAGQLGLISVLGMLGLLWLVAFSEMRAVVLSLGANRNLLADRPLPAAGIMALLALVLWACFVPPHQYDSLVYHLPLPAAYLREGGFVRVENLLYSHFPQNGEMLYTLALALRSELLAQMLMWLAMALSVWWIFEMGKREAPLSAVLLGSLLLCSHTAVMLLSSISYVEPLVMLWTTGAVLSFLRWRQLDAAAPGQRSWLILSAIFTGLALGTKYYSALTAILLGLSLLYRVATAPADERRRRALDAVLYAALTTALFTPWLVKNSLMAGNPFFPFFNALFPGLRPDWNKEVSQAYFSVLNEYLGVRSLADLARLPGLLLTNDLKFGKGMDVLGTVGWELSFWSLPLAVWAALRNRYLLAVLGFCAGYLLLWATTGIVLRFLTPLAPLLCLLSGCGLYALWQALSTSGKAALGLGVGLLGVTHLLLFFFIQFGVYGAGELLFGLRDHNEYLGSRLEYYPCARARVSEPNARILLVGETRSYYVENDSLASSTHAPNAWLRWADESRNPAELAARIRKEGFSHLLIVPRELRRLGPALGSVSPHGRDNWAGLESKHLTAVARGPGCGLYAVRAP